MKIILIQQADTGMEWETRYDAASFERAAERERSLGAASAAVRRGDASSYRVYTGTTRGSAGTAELLFDLPEPVIKTPLLDDVPLRAFWDTEKPCPLRVWQAAGRAQWFLGSRRQSETRTDTMRRVGEFLDLLEAEDRDCIVVSRGLTMAALKTALRRRGYCLEGGALRPRPLDRVRATKRTLHCGGCSHNCLLTEPKCQRGRDRAAEWGV